MGRLIWAGWLRTIAFWAIIAGTVYMIDMLTQLDVGMIGERLGAALGPVIQGREFAANSLAALSQQDFAFSLAGLLAAFGAGLLLAFLVLYAIAIRFSLWRIRRLVRSNKDDRLGFAKAYETTVYPKLLRHPLIGHAWREFDETLLKGEVEKGGVIGNTVRPQSFINYGLVRERLMGLKMIGSIPGYFVGIGLLLTFTGIVLALHKASEATTASLISNDTPAMMTAMTDLLGVASFKFATSIAGLGVSIILALLFKMIVIGIEASFAPFCEQVEAQLRYTAPQSIAAEINETAKEQSAQLKEINSDRFFSRMGEQFAPQVAGALESAIAPMTQSIDDAMKAMSSQSQTGVGDMIERFSSTVQGSAGTELKQLGETLAKMHTTLETTQKGLHGTGEEFATRMSEAANALRETFDRANTKLDSDLGSAASGASAKVEDAMGRVMERLEGQVGTLMAGLAAFGTSNAANLDDTVSKVATAQQAAVDHIASASSEAAKALEAGLGEALGRVAAEIERFAVAMRSGETALAQQATAIEAATEQTRQVAGSFTQTASDVRTASVPLLQAGDRIAKTSEQMGISIERAASSLEIGNAATTALAASLTGQLSDLREIWESYKTHFDRVDESLGRAVEHLGQASDGQLQTIKRYATEMNSDLATVMNSFKPLLENLEQNSDSIAGSVESLAKTLPRLAAE